MTVSVRQQIVENNTMEQVFGKFNETFKEYKDNASYEEMEEVQILFDSTLLQIDDTTDIEMILVEINKISRRTFMYGVVYESQQRVLQQLEDEFSKWHAEKYLIVEADLSKGGTKTKRTEAYKDNIIMTLYAEEHDAYKEKIRNEKYRCGLLKRVVNGFENYSFKLHSILNYRQLALQKGL